MNKENMEPPRDTKSQPRPKGGLITMPSIFANEICEKLAVVGFQTNMISYLTQQLHMPLTKAANTLTNFSGTSSLTPLLGAFIADSYAGKFWTITIASVVYQIGMISLTTSAILPKLRPAPGQEASGSQLAVLYLSLFLAALGSGGIRPCVVAFGAEQFDESDPKQKNVTWKYFNWYYFAMGASILVAVTVVVYIQDNVGWGWGLGIPTFLMLLSIITFVVGYRYYRHLDPSGSPFTRLVQVCIAAYKKRKMSMVNDPKLLYENEELDASISSYGKLIHTKQLLFLDKAAIVSEEDNTKAPNLWKLNTVHRVEELKSVIRMGPIWASGIILITAYAQQSTFSLQQAKTMDRHLTTSFQIPAGLDRGITFLHRMGIGFVISVLATLVAGFVEIKRKQVALAHGLVNNSSATIPISVFWLVPQYGLHGVAEAFMSIGHLEFFYDQAPESMRSTATALFWTSISFGNYLSSMLVSTIHKVSAAKDGSNWLPDDNINKGKLEYFYWLITLLQVINLVYYLICAKFYTFKPVQLQIKDEDDKSVEGLELGSRV
ncbi:hypothetical protein KSS87_023213 [Heliosperma pusillum]|nr:hypothetical protein KSS87_023213 [Heliosperma pusillum]